MYTLEIKLVTMGCFVEECLAKSMQCLAKSMQNEETLVALLRGEAAAPACWLRPNTQKVSNRHCFYYELLYVLIIYGQLVFI